MTQSALTSQKRYNPVLAALHWLVAVLMFAAVFLRPEEEEGRRQAFQQGANFARPAPSLDIHMVIGVIILALLVIRLIVRWTTKHPEWASTGSALLDKVGVLTHYALYFLTFSILFTGAYLANQRGLMNQILGIGSAVTEGIRRGRFFIGAFHEWSWFLLVLLLLLHIGGTLYHQFIIKDKLLGRMWFGK